MKKGFEIFSIMFLIAFLFTTLLEAEVLDHLKPIEGKSDVHKMKNIDFIYMINLDQRPEKWAFCEEQFTPYGIFPYRFSAVNGWELSLEAINDVGVKCKKGMLSNLMGTSYNFEDNFMPSHEIVQTPGKTYFCHCMSRGAIGIVLSHLSILQDALNSDYNTIWVLEDDVEIVDDPRKISELINKLDHLVGKENWDVLFTDRNTRNRHGKEVPAHGHAKRPNFTPSNPNQFLIREPVGKDFIRVGARYGAYSMILRKSGIKKILNFIKSHGIFLPYDMDFYLPSGIKMYSVKKNIITNYLQAVSDNGGPTYLQKSD